MRAVPLILLITLAVVFISIMIFAMVTAVKDDQKKRRAKEREQQTKVWLKARPTGASRDEALDLLAEAFADRRITPEEHTKMVAVVEKAKTNQEIVDITKDLEVVEKPE